MTNKRRDQILENIDENLESFEYAVSLLHDIKESLNQLNNIFTAISAGIGVGGILYILKLIWDWMLSS